MATIRASSDSVPSKPTWRLENCVKQAQKLSLQVQPFQVLAFFLQHPGELVTREQLRSHIWPNDTFVDFDHALNTSMAKIRLALGRRC